MSKQLSTPDQGRRQFLSRTLKGSSALMLGAAALSSQLAIAQQSVSAQFNQPMSGEDYWQMAREQFSFPETTVPMNAAKLCPSFRSVAEQVAFLTADIDQDCSFNNRSKFLDLLENTRALVAAQLKVSAGDIALVRNTSEANNIINNGLDLSAGDEVIIWDENHPTTHVAWQVRAARYGFNVIKVAKACGIYVCVDGAQTWGAMALDVKALGMDSFAASAHKWYKGPKEVGLLYIKADQRARIWPGVVASGWWGNGPETRLSGARKFESLGQRDDAALAALSVAARIHDSIGSARIEQRTVQLSQHLKSGVQSLGLPLVTPLDTALSFGVVVVQTEAGQGGPLSNRLYEEFRIAGAGTGGLRLCLGIYNTLAHVDRALAGIKQLMV